MSAALPRMCTGSSAFVREVSFRSTSAGSSVSDSSTSASTGIAPVASTAFAVAFQVYAGMITSSPAPIPRPIRAQMRADEPALTQSAYGEPMCSANSRSNVATSFGPSPTP